MIIIALILLVIWFGIGWLLAGVSGVILYIAIGVALWWLTPSLESADDIGDDALNAFQKPLSKSFWRR